MKILSKKKYNKLIEDFEELQKKVEELKRINESIGKSWKIKRQVARQMLEKIFVMFAKILTVIRTIMGLFPLTV